MKRTALIMIIAILLAIPVFAGEFSGDYVLNYPSIGINVNFGYISDGQFRGFDQTIPFGEDAQAMFDQKKAEALALIESLDLPQTAKDQLITLVEGLFTALSNGNDQLYTEMTALLPGQMHLDQLFWPFDTTILMSTDALLIPWPGSIDPTTGQFDLITLSIPVYDSQFGDWDLSMIGLLLGNGRIDRTNGYSGTGFFRVNYEILLEQPNQQVILGVGLTGDWIGIR